MPAVTLGKAASDLVVSVLMHKLRGILLAEGPEIVRGLVAGIVKGETARLQMRGAEIVALADQIDLERPVADLNALCREGGRAVAPKIEAVVPLALVKRGAVKFIVLDESPLFISRKDARSAVFDGVDRSHIAIG